MKIKISLLAIIIMMISNVSAHRPNYIKSDIRDNLKNGDKLAILIVHFGTSHVDAREKSLDTFTKEVQAHYPDINVFEAYSSRIVLRILKKRGIYKFNPEEMLMKLYLEGYTHVVIQTTAIIHGTEMASLRHDMFRMKKFFKEIRLGKPLLYSVEDAQKTVDILAKNRSDNKVYLFGGHGTYHPITASYAMVDYMFKDKGYDNIFVSTVEGYPTFEGTLEKLKATNKKDICIVPFMFVAGEHAKNDLKEDWKKELEKEGFNITLEMKGLGENPEIRQILLDHLDFAFNHKNVNISDKKKAYSKEKEKD